MDVYWYYIIAFIIFLLIEATSYNLVTIWLALSALVTSVYAYFFPSQTFVQLAIFVIVTLILLALTRPAVKKLKIVKHSTNSDRYIGEEGMVIEEINPISGKGQIKIKGQIWSAASENGSVIEEGKIIKIKKIEGVKLIV